MRVWSGFMWPLQDHWQALANATVRLRIPRTPAVSSRTAWNLPNRTLFHGINWLNSRLTHHGFLVYSSLQIVWKNLIASLKYHFCVMFYNHYSWHNMYVHCNDSSLWACYKVRYLYYNAGRTPSFDIWPASSNCYDMQLLQWPRSWCQRYLEGN